MRQLQGASFHSSFSAAADPPHMLGVVELRIVVPLFVGSFV